MIYVQMYVVFYIYLFVMFHSSAKWQWLYGKFRIAVGCNDHLRIEGVFFLGFRTFSTKFIEIWNEFIKFLGR